MNDYDRLTRIFHIQVEDGSNFDIDIFMESLLKLNDIDIFDLLNSPFLIPMQSDDTKIDKLKLFLKLTGEVPSASFAFLFMNDTFISNTTSKNRIQIFNKVMFITDKPKWNTALLLIELKLGPLKLITNSKIKYIDDLTYNIHLYDAEMVSDNIDIINEFFKSFNEGNFDMRMHGNSWGWYDFIFNYYKDYDNLHLLHNSFYSVQLEDYILKNSDKLLHHIHSSNRNNLYLNLRDYTVLDTNSLIIKLIDSHSLKPMTIVSNTSETMVIHLNPDIMRNIIYFMKSKILLDHKTYHKQGNIYIYIWFYVIMRLGKDYKDIPVDSKMHIDNDRALLTYKLYAEFIELFKEFINNKKLTAVLFEEISSSGMVEDFNNQRDMLIYLADLLDIRFNVNTVYYQKSPKFTIPLYETDRITVSKGVRIQDNLMSNMFGTNSSMIYLYKTAYINFAIENSNGIDSIYDFIRHVHSSNLSPSISVSRFIASIFYRIEYDMKINEIDSLNKSFIDIIKIYMDKNCVKYSSMGTDNRMFIFISEFINYAIVNKYNRMISINTETHGITNTEDCDNIRNILIERLQGSKKVLESLITSENYLYNSDAVLLLLSSPHLSKSEKEKYIISYIPTAERAEHLYINYSQQFPDDKDTAALLHDKKIKLQYSKI